MRIKAKESGKMYVCKTINKLILEMYKVNLKLARIIKPESLNAIFNKNSSTFILLRNTKTE